ncbi:ubiquitin carboxyl-terminal hydrolase 36 [Planococcus citri]|uniref:ubiquitin carboxyl-terminal hydrolase 36 n=1 Tax=Planococcus citri TaxID=170843 RepID=UPI0031F83A17
MNSTSGDLISLALKRSFLPKYKKLHKNSLDEHIVANARRILSTKIDYVLTTKYSTASFLDSLKKKYIVLKPSKLNKKKKKKSKNRSDDTDNSKAQMKDTEQSGQNLSLPTPKTVLFSPDAVQLGWKNNSYPVGSGFVNSGTTCYINSTLQALFHVPSFVNWLLDDKKHHMMCEKMNGVLHTECIVCAMSKTLHTSHRLNGSSLRPRLIVEKVKTICKHLSPFRQEDAHEFLRYLMEAMEKSYIATLGIQAKKLDSYSKETTPLNQIFGGYIRTEVTCLECSQVSTTFQHFQDLILDIRQASTSTVYDGLENYFSKERLDGDESYHCEHCKKKVSAYKKFSIEKAPNALCIQLKRFNINSFYGGSKISKLISIPQNIDLSKFKHKKGSPSGTPLKYRLVSMVFHHGPSANSGHYTALGCTSAGPYYYFNDEQVYPTHLGQYTNNPNAYIMFYELEKPIVFSENSSSSSSIKSSSSSSTISLPNGYMNGTMQRSNGFFTKRETSFSTSSIHSKQPSLEPMKCEKYIPLKPANVTTPNASSKNPKLVPYMSSESESSDSENDTGKPGTNKNNNSSSDDRVENGLKHSKTLSPLAKRNSTLTSLLNSSSSKDDNPSYRAASSSPTKGFSQLDTSTDNNENDVDNDTNSKYGLLEKPEKRNAITFSFKKKDKIEGRENGDSNDRMKPKYKQIGVATPYYANDSQKSNGDGDRDDGQERITSDANTNGLTNGVNKTNGMFNGNRKVHANGWIVTDRDNENEFVDDENMNGEKTQNHGSTKSNWVVTEKSNQKNSSPLKEHKQDVQENGRKFYNDKEDAKNDNYSQQNCSQNGSTNPSYSSYNGYGGKVLSWNGDNSYINREADKERKESSKRAYSQSYDDEMDRGKIKKPKYQNRNENCDAGPRKNPFQQYSNFNNNNHNNYHHHHHHHRTKKPSWMQNGFNHQHRNNRGYQPNHYRQNYNNRPYNNNWGKR